MCVCVCVCVCVFTGEHFFNVCNNLSVPCQGLCMSLLPGRATRREIEKKLALGGQREGKEEREHFKNRARDI